MKKALSLFVILASLFIIQSLITSIWSLWQKQDVVKKAQQDLVRQKQENISLKKRLSRVQQKDFVEEEARDKLFLGKAGESQIIMPNASQSATATQKELVKPNWQQWLDLFFSKGS